MKTTSFKETNKVLGDGGNPSTDQLPVCHAMHPDYSPDVRFQISRWKLSDEELEIINKNRELWLSIMGHTQPPCLPTVYNPFTKIGFIPCPIEKTPGATGQHTHGKIHPSDEGELRIAIAKKDDTVVIDFGKSTAWIGMTAAQAKSFGELIIKKSQE